MHTSIMLALLAALLTEDGAQPSCEAALDLLVVSPAPGSVVAVQEQVRFEGSAYDCHEGVLAGDAIAWYSDRDGLLGTGVMLRVSTLSQGAHTVTMTATGRDGQSASASFSLRVEVEAPGPE
ncbi:hypothetical protein GM658_09725 [Pseudoduganella eburnea]|uniref:Ig-like domain-containing protein n=1 Tax=Massilia eburnea TaxID=1776165 RepID=A0A6L6QGV9_9BURK|nr:PKD domain-containing protein [Massilia eburnea]MTW10883.1 hypothetical protein [Massilia eburnea]